MKNVNGLLLLLAFLQQTATWQQKGVGPAARSGRELGYDSPTRAGLLSLRAGTGALAAAVIFLALVDRGTDGKVLGADLVVTLMSVTGPFTKSLILTGSKIMPGSVMPSEEHLHLFAGPELPWAQTVAADK